MYSFIYLGLYKYNQEVYDRIMILFDLLPVSAVLNNKFFCAHGGLSPELNKVTSKLFSLKTLIKLREQERFQRVVCFVILCGLIQLSQRLVNLEQWLRRTKPEVALIILVMN